MDSFNSFKGYGKVDEAEERAFRKKTRRRIAIIVVAAIILAAIIIVAVVASVVNNKKGSSDKSKPSTSSAIGSLKAVCNATQYEEACLSSLSSVYDRPDDADPEEIFKYSLKVAIDELTKISALPDQLAAGTTDAALKQALVDCKGLFDDAIQQLNDSLSSMLMQPGQNQMMLSDSKLDDIRTWISAAATDQETCLDGLAEFSPEMQLQMQNGIRNSTEFTSNSLAIATKILTILQKLDIPLHRKLLSVEFPTWVSSKDRRLLQARNPTPDVVVAKDGSGQFTTIGDAVALVPKNSDKRFVIFVKAGTYEENVEIDKAKWNVMIYGEGMNKTIVSGSKNRVDGTPTFSTATFIAVGKNFMAKDIGFRNTAGPEKHQAVALRSGSDRSVFYRCSFDAFQDTLYAHSNRQFYRDCNITGTVDFIFGNAAVVLQGCRILPRQPGESQMNTITAQGRIDPNQNTGISIQGCQIQAFDSVSATTYLGRPWKPYSTTIIMQTGISNIVDPAGWLPFNGLNTEPPKTIFYAEYDNSGPGSGVAKRVNWPGYYPSISKERASKFTVNPFIQGSEWLPATGVSFGASL